MCESRAVPSGKVYRQLFDAQVQLSRSLLAGRRETRTDCLSADDSNTQCSANSSREQQVDDANEATAVSHLPDILVNDHPSSDIIQRLAKKRSKKHEEALKQLDAELTEITEVYETQVKTVSEKLLLSQEDVNLNLGALKDRMKSLEYLEHATEKDVYDVWEEVEKEVEKKKIIINELNQELTKAEGKRTEQIRAVLGKYCPLLEKISFLPSSDVHRLIHNEATMLNQSLLANRRSVARLLLLLHEENLQQQSLLRLHWEDCLSCWMSNRVKEVTSNYMNKCCRMMDEEPVPVQQLVQGMKITQHDLTEKLCEVINSICSLVIPSCSISMVNDWFSQLTDVNEQIYSLHTDFLHELGCCYEQTRQDRLSVVERCKEELLGLQLTEKEMDEVVCAKLLHLIGQRQTLDEKQLAACGVFCESVHDHAVSLSQCVFHVLRGAALLWERLSLKLKKKEDKLKKELDNLRNSHQPSFQKKRVHLDVLLSGLRQDENEDSLKISLNRIIIHLQEVKESCREFVSDQCQLLDCHPPRILEELFSYSSSLSSFFHLNHTYRPSVKELQKLHPAFTTSAEEGHETQNRERLIMYHSARGHTNAELTKSSKKWLPEAESALKGLCDDKNDITFISSRGVSYTGPAFACPGPDLLDSQQQETNLSVFPVELLGETLSRMRVLFVDNLEQYFHDTLNSTISMVTLRKETLHCELELQLQQLNYQHIETNIYQLRLDELQQHRQHVDVCFEEVMGMLASCQMELLDLQTSIDKKNKEFTATLSKMEKKILRACSSQRLEALSSDLQSCQEQHIKDTQHCQTSFRQTVGKRLEEVRLKVTQLNDSFRLFSEGGDYAPREVRLFQRRLKEETKEISEVEESIYWKLEQFESRSLQQVKDVSDRFEETIALVKSELMFTEKIKRLISDTQTNIKTEAATNNQQQTAISNRIDHLRKMLQDTQVTSDQVCSLLSSVIEELKEHCQYLDFSLENVMDESLLACSKSRKQVHSAPPPSLAQPSQESSANLLGDPALDIIKSLNRFSMTQDDAAKTTDKEEGKGATSGKSSAHNQQRGGAKRRYVISERRLHVFGPKPDQDQTLKSFSSVVNSVLWIANTTILQFAEEFFRSRYGSRFFSVNDSLDQWAEGIQQRLLGYQEQARKLLSTSREELVNQFTALMGLLQLMPKVLISTHEQQHEAEFRNNVGAVRTKLMETMAASEKEKCENARQLQISHRDEHLQTLNSREECRQQQIHSNICSSYQSLQECVRIRGEEFVTSLASLTETLLHLLDNLLTVADPKAVTLFQRTKGSTVKMETGEEPLTAGRTFSGIPYLITPADSTAGPPSNVITSTASFTTTRCTSLHVAVIELRDAAVKRFEQLLRSESSSSAENKERELRKLQRWSSQWKQQIDSRTHPGSR